MAEIKLFKETLYDIVGDKIREFCEKNYYDDIVCSFEQSYDGIEWTKEVEFASFYNGTDICYENDWNEGQTYLRNLRIWHLKDSEPIKHGRWVESWRGKWHSCSVCWGIPPFNLKGDDMLTPYCPHCGAKMDLDEAENENNYK